MSTTAGILNYRREELAVAMRLSTRTIDRLRKAGEIKSYLQGRVRLFPADSAHEYIRRRLAESDSDRARLDAYGADPSP